MVDMYEEVEEDLSKSELGLDLPRSAHVRMSSQELQSRRELSF